MDFALRTVGTHVLSFLPCLEMGNGLLVSSDLGSQVALPYLLHEDDEGGIVSLLRHQAAIGCRHVEAVRGFSRAHLGLGGVLLPQSICAVVGHNPPVPEDTGHCQQCGLCPVCARLRKHIR